MGIKQYFDEPQEIIGLIGGVLGLALAIASFFVDALPVEVAFPIGMAMFVGGGSMIGGKFLMVVKEIAALLREVRDALQKQDKDKPDGE